MSLSLSCSLYSHLCRDCSIKFIIICQQKRSTIYGDLYELYTHSITFIISPYPYIRSIRVLCTHFLHSRESALTASELFLYFSLSFSSFSQRTVNHHSMKQKYIFKIQADNAEIRFERSAFFISFLQDTPKEKKKVSRRNRKKNFVMSNSDHDLLTTEK